MVRTSRGPARVLLAAVALAGAMLVGSAPAFAQEQKIGYIRSASILDQYAGARTAVESFGRDVQTWNDEAANRKTELDALERELAAQGPGLSDAVRRQKEQDYQRKLGEYDQYVQSIWGPQGLVATRNEELFRDVVARVQRAARKLATDLGYTFILDASDGNIIYADKEHDLTEEVLEALNQPE